MVREGDQVMFATEDENESTLWVQAIYRATGQSHKPVPPTTQPSRLSNTQLSKEKGGQLLADCLYNVYALHVDRASVTNIVLYCIVCLLKG